MSRMRIDDIEIRDADIFARLLDNFPDMIHSVDETGKIIYTNKKASDLLGYTHEELLSMNMRQLYADRVLEMLETGFTDLKERGDKDIPESFLKSKDGEEIPVEIRSFSIYDDEGNFLRTFSILRDRRKIKELEQSLVHAGRLAAIGELASGVAHDINNPLTVIMLSNEMLTNDLEKRQESEGINLEKSIGHSKSINKASKSIQKLSDHLRNFSRGMAEKFETIDLYAAIADALFITQNKIVKSGVSVENNTRDNTYFINGLANSMEQVFVNLIGNACDAMANAKEKKLSISITSDIKEGTECWRCDVSDTGSGIPEDLIDDVFHSFFTTKKKGEGTGLGLSISRGIVRDHQGDLTVETKINEGTTFSVYIPSVSGNPKS